MNQDNRFQRTVVVLLGIIAAVLIVGALRAAQSIVVPIMLAVFVALLASPGVSALERRGWPSFFAVGVVLMGLIAFVVVVGAALGTSVQDLASKSADYRDLFMGRLSGLTERLGDEAKESVGEFFTVFDPGKAMSLAAGVLSSVTNLLGNAALILLILIFILLEVSGFPRKLRASLPNAQAVMDTSAAIAESVKRYITIKTSMSLGTGIAVGIFVALQGLDFPVLWGLLAFLLNYIPNIGSLLAAIPAVMLSFIQLGTGHAAVTALGYLAINTIFGSIVEPRLAGRGVGLSPLIVVLSLVFWGWVLGPVGMLLSVPLTATLKIGLAGSEETRWLAVMLGPAPTHEASSQDSSS
jgi:predicted PurR-regulated permease PerM